jgi:hypothetical protein
VATIADDRSKPERDKVECEPNRILLAVKFRWPNVTIADVAFDVRGGAILLRLVDGEADSPKGDDEDKDDGGCNSQIEKHFATLAFSKLLATGPQMARSPLKGEVFFKHLKRKIYEIVA